MLVMILLLNTVIPWIFHVLEVASGLDYGDEVNADLCTLPNGVFADPHSCTIFIRCHIGKPKVDLCSNGLHFNPLKLTCDFSKTGNCSDLNDFEASDGVETNDFQCSEDGPNIYPIQSSCTEYYICKNNAAFKAKCPEGLLLNSEKLTCDYSDNVDCGLILKSEKLTVEKKSFHRNVEEETETATLLNEANNSTELTENTIHINSETEFYSKFTIKGDLTNHFNQNLRKTSNKLSSKDYFDGLESIFDDNGIYTKLSVSADFNDSERTSIDADIGHKIYDPNNVQSETSLKFSVINTLNNALEQSFSSDFQMTSLHDLGLKTQKSVTLADFRGNTVSSVLPGNTDFETTSEFIETETITESITDLKSPEITQNSKYLSTDLDSLYTNSTDNSNEIRETFPVSENKQYEIPTQNISQNTRIKTKDYYAVKDTPKAIIIDENELITNYSTLSEDGAVSSKISANTLTSTSTYFDSFKTEFITSDFQSTDLKYVVETASSIPTQSIDFIESENTISTQSSDIEVSSKDANYDNDNTINLISNIKSSSTSESRHFTNESEEMSIPEVLRTSVDEALTTISSMRKITDETLDPFWPEIEHFENHTEMDFSGDNSESSDFLNKSEPTKVFTNEVLDFWDPLWSEIEIITAIDNRTEMNFSSDDNSESKDLIDILESTSSLTSKIFNGYPNESTEYIFLPKTSKAIATVANEFHTTNDENIANSTDDNTEITNIINTNSIFITDKTLTGTEKNKYQSSTIKSSNAETTERNSFKKVSKNNIQIISNEIGIGFINDTTETTKPYTDYSIVSIIDGHSRRKTDDDTEYQSILYSLVDLQAEKINLSSNAGTKSQHQEVSLIEDPLDITTTPNPVCVSPESNFPYPDDCSKFYHCVTSVPIISSCVTGEHFDPLRGICTHPCLAMCDRNTDCFPSTTSTAFAPVKLCSQNDFLSQPNCNEYLDCTLEVPIKYECPVGLHFNPTRRVCDWPYKAECGTLPKLLLEPTKLFSCPCESCLIPSTTNCSEYYLCLGLTAFKMNCSNNLSFDRNMNTCNYAYLVECNDSASRNATEKDPTEYSAKTLTTERSILITKTRSTKTALFVCPGREGLFKYPGNCGMFYQCSNWYPYPMYCAAKTHFSKISKRCEHPCDAKCDLTLRCGSPLNVPSSDPQCSCSNCRLPSSESFTEYVVCINGKARTEFCPSGQTFDAKRSTCNWTFKGPYHHSSLCPKRNGVFSFKDDCHKFVLCSDGISYVKNCPYTLEYNPVKKCCDWPTGRCNNLDAMRKEMDIFKTEEKKRGWKCPKTFGYFSYGKYSNKFYHCSFGIPALKECSPGLLYNSKYQTCDWEKEVRGNFNLTNIRRCRKVDHAVCLGDREPQPHSLCNMYFDCTNGKACAKQCPSGLYFNNVTGLCDFPGYVKCFNHKEMNPRRRIKIVE